MSQFYNYYIIYSDKFGFVDFESVERLIKNNLCEKIIIFLSTEPHKNVKAALKKYQSIEIKLCKNPKKEAKKFVKDFKSENKGKSIVLYPLEVIADRSMWLDIC